MPNPIETATAKGVAKVAGVEARVKGLKGVFVKLAEQHHEVASLLARAQHASDADKRRDLWNEIKKQLISHEQAELLEIYPGLEADERTRDMARRHSEEAQELEALVDQLDAVAFESEAWKPTLTRLADRMKQHADEEERDFFPKAQQVLGERAAAQLEQPFLKAQAQVMDRM